MYISSWQWSNAAADKFVQGVLVSSCVMTWIHRQFCLTRYLRSCENSRYRDLWNKIQSRIRRNFAALSKVRVALRSLFHQSLYPQSALTKDASCQNWVY